MICKECIFIAGPGAHQSIILRELPQMYLRQYGYALRPENFGESNLNGIIEKLSTKKPLFDLLIKVS